MHPRAKKVITALLLIVGVQAWLIVGRSDYGRNYQLGLLVLAAVFAAIPPANRFLAAILYRLRRPRTAARLLIAIAITFASAGYLYLTAINQQRDFHPAWQDEFCYLIQAHQLAIGRLWMPAHPLGEFFESFMLLHEPVYAAMYFPGAAMMYVPTVWLGLSTWVMPLVISSLAVGVLYLVITQLIDGLAGALAALLLVSTNVFRALSIMVMAQPVLLLLGLLLVLTYLHWRRGKSFACAFAIGLFAGWAAITRPIDALCFATPVGIAMLLDLRRESGRRIFKTALVIILGAAPFLSLQAIFNHRITGSVFEFPFNFYANRDAPQTTWGFHAFDPTVRPQSKLPQKQDLYDVWYSVALQQHRPQKIRAMLVSEYLPMTINASMPQRMLLVLIPAGWLALHRRRRWVLWLTLPLFLALYTFYVFFSQNYPVIVAPAVILNILLGAKSIQRARPRRRGVHVFVTSAIVILAVTNTRELNRLVNDTWYRAPTIWSAQKQLSALGPEPALVLFRYRPGDNPHEEPVYNAEVAYPDDARIIRAHDLGPQKNRELFKYYAARDPNRRVYRFDRKTLTLEPLGTVGELAQSSSD